MASADISLIQFAMIIKNYISLWAGNVGSALPLHLTILYKSLGNSTFSNDPRVCAERECVPVNELLEPFLTSEDAILKAVNAAERQSLHLASEVVAVYTSSPPSLNLVQPLGCELWYVGTFQKN